MSRNIPSPLQECHDLLGCAIGFLRSSRRIDNASAVYRPHAPQKRSLARKGQDNPTVLATGTSRHGTNFSVESPVLDSSPIIGGRRIERQPNPKGLDPWRIHRIGQQDQLQPSMTYICSDRHPWAPMTSDCSISAVLDGPETKQPKPGRGRWRRIR